MAQTYAVAGLTPQQWDDNFFRDYVRASRFKRYMGTDEAAIIQLKEDLTKLHTDRLQRMSLPDLSGLADKIHQQAKQLLSHHDKTQELDNVYRLSRAEFEAGRGVDAILDLIRSEEKTISSALGPNQAKSFLTRVQQFLAVA